MKPYYQEDDITIYHGDARDVLPTLAAGSVDLVLTDPPYPNVKGGTEYFFAGVGRAIQGTTTIGTPWTIGVEWMPEAWRVARLGMMVFCSYHNLTDFRQALPDVDPIGLVTWFKRNAPPVVNNVPHYDTEFIWLLKKGSGLKWRALKTTMYDIPKLSTGCMATERIVDGNGKAMHPAQKPLELLKRLLAVGGSTILDPFIGTGTTLVAAKMLGRQAIGIDESEAYCEIAVRRLSQQVLPLGV